MRIRRSILPFAFLALSATHNQACLQSPRQASSARKTAYPAIMSCASLGKAVESILTDEVRVVAFGEIHKEKGSNLPSTLHYFAAEVIPLLARKKFGHLVIELVPDGPQAEGELAEFGKTRRLGPLLSRWYSYDADYCAMLELFSRAQAFGIKLHGSHASNIDDYLNNFDTIAELIKQRTESKIRSLLAQGERVAAYNGTTHNSISPIPGKEKIIFGRALREELRERYVELDIYLPEQPPSSYNEADLDTKGFISYVPAATPNLINFGNGKIKVILPAFGKVVSQPLLEHPICNGEK